MGNEIKDLGIDKVTEKVYDDVAHPSLKVTGEILSFLPRTIKIWFSNWEKWIINREVALEEMKKSLADKLKEVPPDKIVEPEPYVAIPAIQQLSYSYDSKELREMYANLLAASMNTDTKWEVHPAYVDIIKQLTPDEAKLLKLINRTKVFPLVNILEKNSEGGYFIKLKHFTDWFVDNCENVEYLSSYFDNLCRLRLIEIKEDLYLDKQSLYDNICKNEVIKNICKQPIRNGFHYDIKKGQGEITDFGKSFIKVCLPNDK